MKAKIVTFTISTRIVVPDGLANGDSADYDHIEMLAFDKLVKNHIETLESAQLIEITDSSIPFDEETDEIYALDADNHIIKKGDIVNYFDIEKQGVPEMEEELDIEWKIDEVFPDGETCLISCKEGMQAEVPSIELAKFYNQKALEETNNKIKEKYK